MSDFEQLKAAIDAKMSTNPQIRHILKLLENGKATFNDTAKYTQILSHLLGRELASQILELSDREGTTTQLLRGAYDEVNGLCSQVQRSLDKKAGIGLNPKQAPFPAERVEQYAHSLVDPTVEDSVIKRRAGAGSETITKSYHDDFIETNAEFREDAGMKCYIIRMGTDCCQWCSDVAGKYEMKDQPQGIFRRHDNCDCTIIYDGQVLRGQTGAEGKRGKKWVEVPKKVGAADAVRFTQAQAKALNDKKVEINVPSIDKISKSDIINQGHKLGMEANQNVLTYEIEENLESVKDFEEYARQTFDIKYIQGIEKLRNGTSAKEILVSINKLVSKYNIKYTQIEIYDWNDKPIIAESIMSKLRLNCQYMNRPTALQDLLDFWEDNSFIPSGCNSTAYVGKHEYYHFLYNLDIDNPKSRINVLLNRYSNDGGQYISKNSKDNRHEFVSDLLCYTGKDKLALKLKKDILKLKETRMEGEV